MSTRLRKAGFTDTIIGVKGGVHDAYSDNTMKEIALADAVIFVFPLYAYGIPGALMGLLEDYYRYVTTGIDGEKKSKCLYTTELRFSETRDGVQRSYNGDAQFFAIKSHWDLRFAVCIGTGPIVALTQGVPFLDRGLKKAYKRIVADIADNSDKKAH